MRALRLAVLALVFVLVPNAVALAQSGPSVRWDRFDVDVAVQADGALLVREVQTISFSGTLREGFRVIPEDRTTGISDVAVSQITDRGEQRYTQGGSGQGTFSTSRQDDGLAVTWQFGPASNTTLTFALSYVAHGAVRQYSAGDQVQWKAIYADRPGAVQAGTITVHLPTDAPSDEPTALYLISVSGDATREVGPGQWLDARTVRFSVPSLEARSGAEVRAQFPHGALTSAPPQWQVDADRADSLRQTLAPIVSFVALLLALVIGVGGGAMLFLRWYNSGREPAIGPTPKLLDEPPSDLPAPLAGTLVDGSADLSDAVASLVDLGEQGVLSMTDVPGPPSDVLVTLRRPTDDPTLRPYERVLLTALFDQGSVGSSIKLSDARTRFAAAVPVLEERLHAAVATEGLFTANPKQVRTRYMVIGLLLVVGGLGFAFLSAWLIRWAVGIIWLPGLALTLVGAATLALAQAMPRRTPRGALEAARWIAFKAHLADEQHQGAIDPHHLAYAVAFGLDASFLRRLERVGSQAPQWYGGGSGPVIIAPGGWYGGPRQRSSGRASDTDPSGGGPSGGGPNGAVPPSPQGWSDALAGLLTAASAAMSSGGGSGRWSGGGFGGGGGGGGGSGGFR